MSGDRSAPPRPRPRAARRPRRRRIPLALALVLIVAALVAGVAMGYVARGGSTAAGPVTRERTLPVITVTVPSEP